MPEPAPTPDLDWISAKEAAAMLGVSDRMVRVWADSGELPCLRTPGGWRRFRRGEIEAFIARKAHVAEASQ